MDSDSERSRHTVELLERSRPEDPIEAERVAAAVQAKLFKRTATAPRTFGRYVLLDRLGRGGAGVVHAAYDPELDRKVAIKLLLPTRNGASGSDNPRARLLREAQAVAKLNHPNVITVHDVGTYEPSSWGEAAGLPGDDGTAVYVVMELVRGTDLKAWLRAEPRRCKDVLDKFLAAGRGLAAAHAKGLVHRDFKPSNVMIGEDGRVKVLDFGLARAVATEPPATPCDRAESRSESAPRPSVSALESQITVAGTLMGTPAYMSPEQHACEEATARSDQYAFAVALFEGLYGKLPFAGSSASELHEVKRKGSPAAPSGLRVPTFVDAAVRRALSVDRTRRFDDMNALLGALSRDPARRLRVASLAMLGVLAVGAAAFATTTNDGSPDVCGELDRALVNRWDDTVRQQAKRAFMATGPGAEQMWGNVQGSLDDYIAKWSDARRQACESALLHGQESVADMSRQMLCLDGQLSWVGGLTHLFTEVDTKTASRALHAISALPSPDTCLRQPAAPPPATSTIADADPVLAVEAQLGRANALDYAARYDEALAITGPALAAARELDDPTVTARALQLMARILRRQGAYADAEDKYWESLSFAERAHNDTLVMTALRALVMQIGDDLARPSEAIRLSQYARARAQRAGLGDRVEAQLAYGLGRVYERAGRFDEAVAALEQAHDIASNTLDPESLLVSNIDNMLGVVYDRAGRYRNALEYFTRAFEQRRRTLGEHHPDTATAIANAAIMRGYLGDHRGSIDGLQLAIGKLEMALGTQNPLVAWFYSSLGFALEQADRPADALPYLDRALQIRKRLLGEDHPEYGQSERDKARVLLSLDQKDDALTHALRALTLARRHEDDPRSATAQSILGGVYLERGELQNAAEHIDAALAIRRESLGEHHVVTGYAWTIKAELELARAHFDEARTAAEHGLRIIGANDYAPLDLAWSKFILAKAVVRTEPEKAQQLAQSALDTFEREQLFRSKSDKIAAFLHHHAP